MDQKETAMHTGPIDRLWVVTDPTPLSTIDDILFEADAAALVRQVKGGLSEESHPTLYLDRESAEADALARLALVRGLSAIAGGTAKGDIRTATRVALLDDAGQVVIEADLGRTPR